MWPMPGSKRHTRNVKYCFSNPTLVPSIIYYLSNSYSNTLRSFSVAVNFTGLLHFFEPGQESWEAGLVYPRNLVDFRS